MGIDMVWAPPPAALALCGRLLLPVLSSPVVLQFRSLSSAAQMHFLPQV